MKLDQPCRQLLQACGAVLLLVHEMRACPEKLGTMPGPGCSEKSNLLVREPEDSAVAGKRLRYQ